MMQFSEESLAVNNLNSPNLFNDEDLSEDLEMKLLVPKFEEYLRELKLELVQRNDSENQNFSDSDNMLIDAEISTSISRLNDRKPAALNFIEKLSQYCQTLVKRMVHSNDEHERGNFLMEKYTWDLVSGLMKAFKPQSRSKHPVMTTDRQIIHHLLSTDSRMCKLYAVKSWLENMASENDETIDNRDSYRPSTRQEISEYLRSGNTGLTTHHLSMDPDCVNRPDDYTISNQDKIYLEKLMKAVFVFIRKGSLADAVELCRACQEHWRAVSLLGGVFFHDPEANSIPEHQAQISKSDFTSDSFGEIFNVQNEYEWDDAFVPAGNKNRGLFLTVCQHIANDPNLSNYERAVYGYLCGHIDSVLPVCNRWEDFIWAYYSNWFVRETEDHLKKYPKKITSDEFTKFEPSHCKLEISSANENTLFDAASSHIKEEISEEAKDPFRIVQASLITNSLQDLLNEFLANLNGDSEVEFRFRRILTHLCIALKYFHPATESAPGKSMVTEGGNDEINQSKNITTRFQNFDHSLTDQLICNYVDQLISWEHFDSVALYCSELPSSLQVKKYASLLLSISKKIDSLYSKELDPEEIMTYFSMDINEKKKVLAYAKNYGFDTLAIVLRAAKENFSPPTIDDNKELQSIDSPLAPIMISQIDILQWFHLDQPNAPELMETTNTVFRKFLLEGNLNAAYSLFHSIASTNPQFWHSDMRDKLPRDNYDPVKIEKQCQEKESYYLFINALLSLLEWYSLPEAKTGSEINALNDNARTELVSASRKAVEALNDVIKPTELATWLDFLGDKSEMSLNSQFSQSDRRDEEILRLKEIYLPFLVDKLLEILFRTRVLLPENIEKVMDTVNLVSSEDRKIYQYLLDGTENPPLKSILSKFTDAFIHKLEV